MKINVAMRLHIDLQWRTHAVSASTACAGRSLLIGTTVLLNWADKQKVCCFHSHLNFCRQWPQTLAKVSCSYWEVHSSNACGPESSSVGWKGHSAWKNNACYRFLGDLFNVWDKWSCPSNVTDKTRSCLALSSHLFGYCCVILLVHGIGNWMGVWINILLNHINWCFHLFQLCIIFYDKSSLVSTWNLIVL